MKEGEGALDLLVRTLRQAMDLRPLTKIPRTDCGQPIRDDSRERPGWLEF